MTTETTPTAAESLGLATRYLGDIPLDLIRESEANPRKTFENMDELEASVRRQGVMSPLLVREFEPVMVIEEERLTTMSYELICGARRLRAAKSAGLHMVPAIVVLNCKDDDAAELRLVENTQRSDVHPMEEAEAYEALVKRLRPSFPDPVGEVARRVGKTRAHVLKRTVLLALPAIARKSYRAGNLSLEVAVAIARIPNAQVRAKAAQEIGNGQSWYTADALERIEEQYMLELKSAPFNKNDPELVAGAPACGVCPKRTGNQVDLFGDVESKDLCTDSVCFKKKSDASWKAKAAEHRKAGHRVLTADESKHLFGYDGQLRYNKDFVDPAAKDYHVLGGKAWREVLKGDERPDPVLARSDKGKVKELWDAKEARTLAKAALPASESKADQKQKELERAERKKAKLEKEAIVLAAEALLDPDRHDPAPAERDFLRAVLPVMFEQTRGWEVGKKISQRRGYKSVKAMLEAENVRELRTILLEAYLTAIGDWQRPEAVPAFCKALELNMSEFRKAAAGGES